MYDDDEENRKGKGEREEKNETKFCSSAQTGRDENEHIASQLDRISCVCMYEVMYRDIEWIFIYVLNDNIHLLESTLYKQYWQKFLIKNYYPITLVLLCVQVDFDSVEVELMKLNVRKRYS